MWPRNFLKINIRQVAKKMSTDYEIMLIMPHSAYLAGKHAHNQLSKFT